MRRRLISCLLALSLILSSIEYAPVLASADEILIPETESVTEEIIDVQQDEVLIEDEDPAELSSVVEEPTEEPKEPADQAAAVNEDGDADQEEEPQEQKPAEEQEGEPGTTETPTVDPDQQEEQLQESPESDDPAEEPQEEEPPEEELVDEEGKEEEPEDISYPAFDQSKTVNGIKVRVRAEEGVFPENTELSVSPVYNTELSAVQEAVDSERPAQETVAVSYTFDIKILDEEGNEIQPTDGNKVKVSFSVAQVADTNLTTQVYHISEADGELNASKLDTSEISETVTVETEGFSYYTVEFTYGDLQYVLLGDETIELSAILEFLGLTGEVTSAVSSAPDLFYIYQTDGVWYVSALEAFSSVESLTVVINGIEYLIVVTDVAKYQAGSNGSYGFRNSTWFSSSRKIYTDWGSLVQSVGGITCHNIKNVGPAYCLEPNKEAGTIYANVGNGYPTNSCSSTVLDLLARAMYWGYPNYFNSNQTNAKAAQAATQAMIFDIVCNFVVESSVGGTATRSYHNGTWGFCDPDFCFVSSHEVAQEYARLLARMNQANPNVGIPSYATANGSAFNYLTLTYNASTGLYEGSWTDTSSNYQYYNFSHDYGDGLVITQSGNTLTVTCTPAAKAAYGITESGSATQFMLQDANTPNRTISSGRIQRYHAMQNSNTGNSNINWSNQTFARYVKSSGDETYKKAHLALKATTPTGSITINKTSSNPSISDGNSDYRYNAVYGIYSDSGCTTLVQQVTLTEGTNMGTATVTGLALGNYWVKEITAPDGFELSTAVSPQITLSEASISGTANMTDVPIPTGFPLTIHKSSSNPSITNGNSCYSLAGAQYGVYATQADAEADTNRMETLTTNASGQATSTNNYPADTYYIKELTPSPGYLLDPAVHAVTVNSDGTVSGNSFTEVPTDDPAFLRIRKVTNGGTKTITSSSAVFKVEYYPNSDWSGSPTATWYYKTINGLCFLNDSTYLDATRSNSPIFTDSGGNATFPLGTVRISEEAAPTGYQRSNVSFDAEITQPTTGGLGEWNWVTTVNGTVNYEAEGATYENAPELTTLTVQKTVTGNLGDRSEDFNFTIQLTDPEGDPVTGPLSYTGSRSGTITLDATGTGSFTLCHGEILTFQGVQVGSTYAITEADYGSDGYTQSSTNATGTIAASGVNVSFTNNRQAIIQTGQEISFRDSVILLMVGTAMMCITAAWIWIKKRKEAAEIE